MIDKSESRGAETLALRQPVKAPLQLKLQARVGIVEQLQTAGGSMTKRRLFNMRRDRSLKPPTQKLADGWDKCRKTAYLWNLAMLQLRENGIVEQTGTGRRGDPVTVRLVKALPATG